MKALQIAALCLTCTAISHATVAQYQVNLSIGSNGSVTGDIVTDGNLGLLATSDFVDWNLFLSQGSSSVSLLGPLSGNNSIVSVSGSDVSATAQAINFNSSNSDSGYFFFETTVGNNFLCFGSGNGVCAVEQQGTGKGMSINSVNQFTPLEGTQAVAVSGTPEPATLLMSGGALLAAFLFSRSRVRSI